MSPPVPVATLFVLVVCLALVAPGAAASQEEPRADEASNGRAHGHDEGAGNGPPADVGRDQQGHGAPAERAADRHADPAPPAPQEPAAAPAPEPAPAAAPPPAAPAPEPVAPQPEAPASPASEPAPNAPDALQPDDTAPPSPPAPIDPSPTIVPTPSPAEPVPATAPLAVAPPAPPPIIVREQIVVYVPAPPPAAPPAPPAASPLAPPNAPWADPIEEPRTAALVSLSEEPTLSGQTGLVLFGANLPDDDEQRSQGSYGASARGRGASGFVLAVPLVATVALLGLAFARSGVPEPAPARPRAGLRGILLLAQEAVQRGDHAEAARWFETALAIQPRLAVAHFCLGLCLEELGRQDEALESLARAVALDPTDPVARYRLARAHALAGDTQAACANLWPLIEAQPDVGRVASEDDGFAGLRDHPLFLRALGRL